MFFGSTKESKGGSIDGHRLLVLADVIQSKAKCGRGIRRGYVSNVDIGDVAESL